MIEVFWTGEYPNLCKGEWKLFIDGKDYSLMIPKELRYSPMNTYGTYQEWHFEDWEEVFESYEDGLMFSKWLAENPWVNKIPATPLDVYCAFAEKDWRHNSCGGCI